MVSAVEQGTGGTIMQIVIEIPKALYNDIQSRDWKNGELVFSEEWRAIHNGTPLPKEHGRLIDTDELVKEICIEYKANSIYELPDELRSFIKKYLNEVPTILKPTTEYMIKNYAFSKSEE